LGLDFAQFHYYGAGAPLPPARWTDGGPWMLGEIATAVHYPWPILGRDQSVFRRLQHLEELGYQDIFLWSADPRGEVRWMAAQQHFTTFNIDGVQETLRRSAIFRRGDRWFFHDSLGHEFLVDVPPYLPAGASGTSVDWGQHTRDNIRRFLDT